jgi:opacity protein-like surface antigen
MRNTLKFIALFASVALLTSASFAQAKVDSIALKQWKVQWAAGLGMTQSAYSDNWGGGETGSLIWVSDFNLKAERQYSTNWYHGNELKLAFGQSHSQNKDTHKWSIPVKSTDKIRYDGILRYTRGWVIDPYLGFTFESQFLDATDPAKKRYVNPIELTEATGVARTIINHPDKTVLTSRIGVAFKQRFNDFTLVDSVNGNQSLHETTSNGGAEWVTELALGSAKAKYSFNSRLTLFKSLVHSRSGGIPNAPKENDDWKAPTVNWDNVLHANVTSILQVSLAWQWLYEKPVSKGGRFKETLSLGLAYKFANYTAK